MTWALSASGSQTASVGTEHILTTDTTNGTYYFEVNVTNLANGDILELRVYTITLVGGTLQIAWKSTYGPVPPIQDVCPSPPQPSDQSLKVTLKQTAGTGRIFPWKLLRI
jgi:flagellar capping protein FliD